MSATPDADDLGSSTEQRILRTRVAELEHEVTRLQDAASEARALVSTMGSTHVELRRQIDSLQARVEELTSIRGSFRALRQAGLRRVRAR